MSSYNKNEGKKWKNSVLAGLFVLEDDSCVYSIRRNWFVV